MQRRFILFVFFCFFVLFFKLFVFFFLFFFVRSVSHSQYLSVPFRCKEVSVSQHTPTPLVIVVKGRCLSSSIYTISERSELAPNMFILCLDYGLRTLIDLIKANGFALKKTKSRCYPTETMTVTDYADDLTLLA